MDSRKYYSSLVKLYTVYKLKHVDAGLARLYLFCFSSYRFRQINDNLTGAGTSLVGQYEKEADVGGASRTTGAQRGGD